jgi:hypothetical protein
MKNAATQGIEPAQDTAALAGEAELVDAQAKEKENHTCEVGFRLWNSYDFGAAA